MQKRFYFIVFAVCCFLFCTENELFAKNKDRERRKIEEARAKTAEAQAERARANAEAEKAKTEAERLRLEREKDRKKQKDAGTDWNAMMHKAIRNGNVDQFKFAIQCGADIKSTRSDWNGDSVLHTAVRANKPEFVKLLIEQYKADVNLLNFQMSTPLYLAAIAGYDDIVKILLAHKADIEKLSGNGLSPFQVAVRHGNVTTAKLLQEAGCIIPNGIEKYARTPEMQEYVQTLPKPGKKPQKK